MKRADKRRKFASTDGRSKGLHPASWIKAYARSNRSHKWPNYETFCESVGKRKGSSE